jgi:hypothetical protein
MGWFLAANSPYIVKRAIMKTIIQHLLNILDHSAFSNEKMPALIPVKVITKIVPKQHQ